MEHDDATNARLAGELAAPWGSDLAARGFRVASTHWERHGARDEAEAMREALATLRA